METADATDSIEQLRERASREFWDITDFIWKAPHLIDHEAKLEAKKLDAYFPDKSINRSRRKESETRKLEGTFPYMISTGNLFSVISVFETYLLLLAGELQVLTGLQIADVKGSRQGINKLFSYFQMCGVPPESVPNHAQILAAIKIRNCLMHASGILSWSKDEEDLRRIERSMLFLPKEDRERHRKSMKVEPFVKIVSSSLGDRIVIQNIYAYYLSSYLREYFMKLCIEFISKQISRRTLV